MTNLITAKVDKHSINMVRQKAFKLKKTLPPRILLEDLEQSGMLGLLKAIQKYNSNVGPFEHYAQKWINGAMLNYIDEKGINSKDTEDIEIVYLESNEPSPEMCVMAYQTQQIIENSINSMNDRYKLILDLYYDKDFSITEIAKLLNVTVPVISHQRRLALKSITIALRDKNNE